MKLNATSTARPASAFEEDRLEVTVASGLLAKLLDTRYGTSIRLAAGDAFGNGKPVEVAFRVDRAVRSWLGESPAPAQEHARPAPAQRTHVPQGGRCTFENYLVGKSRGSLTPPQSASLMPW